MNMKKIILSVLSALLIVGCKNDDTDFSAYINGTSSTTINIINIVYNGTSVSVSGDKNGYVTTNGADVLVNTGTSSDSLLLVLSGSSSDGSLIIYRQRKFGIRLNGVSINNEDGPAINNQCGKGLYIEVADGTTNTLSDGASYIDVYDASGTSIDQKGALFSEGQIFFSGTGTLNVTGNCKNAIASDDYIVFGEATIKTTATVGNAIKVKDGVWINSGVLDISATADGGRGIKCDSAVVVSGGTTTITTSGDCVYDEETADYSSAACIKSDWTFTMTGGTLTMTSTGDGGKGINCDKDITVSGGTFVARTTGSNDYAKPKAVKSDTGIIVSGGSFTATVNKSWACDNGTDSDIPSDHLTVQGTPTSATIAKKSVEIVF